jgi:hypothetical protein
MAQELTYDDAYLESLEELDTEELAPDTFDADADYNRPAPPIPDGVYQMKFSNGGVFHESQKVPYRMAQWKNETRPHAEIAVKGVIIAPDDSKIDGKFVFTGFPLTTKPDPEKNNASAVGAAFKALTGKPIAGLKALDHVKQLDEVLKGEPIGYARVQNILRDQDAEKAFSDGEKARTNPPGSKRPRTVYGQKKIMALKGGTNAAGEFTGAADHPETGVRCAARAEISSFMPIDYKPKD